MLAAAAATPPVLAAADAEADAGGTIESSPGLFLQLTYPLGAKLGFTWRFAFPFMTGDSPLTRGNNIAVTPGFEMTPVSFNFTANAVWTPIAFAEVVAGGRVGSGWGMPLGDGYIRGIGLNLVNEADGTPVHDYSPLDGALWELRAGAALQGDLSAFVPGEWNQVIFRTFHGVAFEGYSRASDGQAWFFENEEGESRNGLLYRGNILLGYRMPLPLNMVALLAEAETFLSVMDGGEAWGDHLTRWTFSGILSFGITERLGATVLTQFWTRRNFVETDWEDLHFTRRTLADSGPQRRLDFRRVVLMVTYSF